MHKPAKLLFLLFGITQYASAVGSEGIHFEHKDWELACDNTRTCRAAGYSDERFSDFGVSVLLTRRAGPGTPIQAQLQLAETDQKDLPQTLQMQIDGRPLGTVRLKDQSQIGDLSPAQTTALLEAITKDREVMWTVGAEEWRLPTTGANAVLLKMDEFQGRLGTTSALVRKGSKPDTSALPYLPPPVITAAPVPSDMLKRSPFTRQQERSLIAELHHTVKPDDCDLLDAPETTLEYAPLSDQQLLVSASCWRAAYNDGSGYWIIQTKAPYSPRLVTTTANGYQQGEISSVQKGRGIADCVSTDTWTWDGKSFIHTASGTTGMCRQIAGGGAWDLPTLVSDVRHPK